MPNTTIHHKKNGTTYLYKIEKSYWDKNKKQPRNKQTCIGKIDPKTGNITPTTTRKNNTPKKQTTTTTTIITTKTHGPNQLLTKITNQLQLTEMLKQSFPNNHQEILSLAFFITQKGLPLSRCELWSQNHTHPYNQPITSQRVSELLKKEITHDKRQHFLSQWLTHLIEKEYLCYDITSVSSYAASNEYLYWGYNRDHEKLPQINLAMLFGQKSGLPAYYRRMPGNISDVVTLQTTIDTLDFLGQSKLQLVLDQGFYSKSNVDALFKKQCKFVLMVPTGRVWVRDVIDRYYESIASPVNYRQTISEGDGGEEVLYMVSHPYRWGELGCECFVHLFYNASRAALDFDGLTRRLVCCKGELESGKRRKEHEELYERFFIVDQASVVGGGLLVSYNEVEIAKFRNRYAGFFCLLTNVVGCSSVDVLEVYRRKEVVECCFDDLKNGLDMRRLRVHSSLVMDGRLFVQFLALILLSQIRVVVKSSEAIRHLSAREVMEALESLVEVTYSGKGGSIVSEAGPIQRSIIEAFGISQKT